MSATGAVLVDSGFLVALGVQSDPRHPRARAFLRQYRGRYLVPSPVVVETCYFLSSVAKVRLLDWLTGTQCEVLEVPTAAFPEVASIIGRYSDMDPDFTDAALVWLAGKHDCAEVLTVDRRDFSAFRIGGRRKFRIVDWDR